MNLSIGSSGTYPPPQFDPSQIKARMDAAIGNLQKTDPTLASKIQKVETDLASAQSGGTSVRAAMKQASTDLGTLSDSDISELKAAFSATPTSGSPTVTGTAIPVALGTPTAATSGSPTVNGTAIPPIPSSADQGQSDSLKTLMDLVSGKSGHGHHHHMAPPPAASSDSSSSSSAAASTTSSSAAQSSSSSSSSGLLNQAIKQFQSNVGIGGLVSAAVSLLA